MKKIVLKSIAITLAVVIVLGALTYGVLALFFPSKLGDFYSSCANYNLSVKYYEKQYNKTNSTGDLYVLCTKVDEDNDSVKAQKYLDIFIEKEDFVEFCSSAKSIGSKIDSINYILAKTVCATYTNSEITCATDRAYNLCKDYGYADYNPFNQMLNKFTIDVSGLNYVETKLQDLKNNHLSPAEKVFAERDLLLIEQLKK